MRRSPWPLSAAVTLAVSVALAHDPPAALRELDRRVAEQPADAALRLERGEVLLALGRSAAALADFARAAALRPELPRVHLACGLALRCLGQHAQARSAAARELERDPRCAQAAVLVARSLADLGDAEAALAAWDRALALTASRSPEHILERADAALAARGIACAVDGLDAASAEVGPLVVVQERVIALLEHAGRFEEAARRVDAVLAQVARREGWLAWQARLRQRSGQPAAAAAARQAALAAIEALPPARRDAPVTKALWAGLRRDLASAPLVPPPSHLRAPATFTAAAALPPTSAAAPRADSEVLVPRGSIWRYHDQGADLGTAWRAPSFDDSSWWWGLAPLGYGDGDELTVVSYGGNPLDRHVTTYFRHGFQIADPTRFALAHVDIQRDDAVAVYLNGSEIVRDNLPAGAIDFRTLALSAVTGRDESAFAPLAIPPTLLVPGTNVLAVEIHQFHPASTDVSFDLELVATPRLSVSRGPYLQQGAPTAATVRWRTDAPVASGVWLGTSPATLTLVASDPGTRTEHEVRLRGLAPNTRYYYAVGTGVQRLAGGTSEFSFRTAPAAGSTQPLRLWVLGDSGTADGNAAAVRDAYLAFAGGRHTDAILMLGDNAYFIGADQEYQRAVFDMYAASLRQTYLWPTIGNHDAFSARSAVQGGVYFDCFTLPTAGECGGLASGTEAYYSFDWGRTHFICLDSHDSDRTPSGPMMSWLRADLANTTADWVIAFFHHPPYSKGSHDSDNPIDSEGRMKDMREVALPILEAGGVDLVLTGHSHSYERSFLLNGHYDVSTTLTPAMVLDRGDGRAHGDGEYGKRSVGQVPNQGAVYVVAGSSGSVAGGAFDHPAHFISLAALGSLVLDVDGQRLEARFLDGAGQVRDSFTLRKGEMRWLTRDAPAISVATGGAQTWSLAADQSLAGQRYLVAGSLGTAPGFSSNGVHLPLNPDGWFSTTLQFANSPFLVNTWGTLDAQGRGQARLELPPLPIGLAGIELYHAFVVLGSGGRLLGASNPVKVRLAP
jgi:tetratricopeptide (TPR) repeat protein